MYGVTYWTFSIRIQLPDPADYVTLNSRMHDIGCKSIIDLPQGKYQLPDGEYFLQSHESFDNLGNRITQIAKDVSRSGQAQVLVCQILNYFFDLKTASTFEMDLDNIESTASVPKADKSEEIELPESFLEEMRNDLRSFSTLREDGLHDINEKLYKDISDFRVIFYPNESRHPGRPHCKVEIGGKTANYDLKTLQRLVGDVGKHQREVSKVLTKHQKGLLKFWDETRPTDQKLK